MPAIISDNFRIANARDYRDLIRSSNFYSLIGKTLPWEDPNDPLINDANPPFPLGSVQGILYNPWRNSLAGKKIGSDAVSLVFPRVDWVPDREYDAYSDNDEGLFTKDFMVVTDDLRVYKCIERPITGNSTNKPTTVDPVVTQFFPSDGYRWKYMFTITAAKALRFNNAEFIPVETLQSDPMDASSGSLQWAVQSAAVDGAILSVQMVNGGAGYTTATVDIIGDGTGATATASINGGVIEYITITDPGSGYTTATVTITGDGNGAMANALVPPPGGHGSDPEREVGAFYAMVYARFSKDEGGNFLTDNDFRQITYVREPLQTSDGLVATGTTYRLTTSLLLTGISGEAIRDGEITQGSATGTVASVDGNTVTVTNVFGSFVPGPVTYDGGSATIDTVTPPELVYFSGDIIFIENRKPIGRATDQAEEFRATVEF